MNSVCCASKEERKEYGGTDIQGRMIRDNISKMNVSKNQMLRPTRTYSMPSTKLFNSPLPQTRSFEMASEPYDEILSPKSRQDELFQKQKESMPNKMLTPAATTEQTMATRQKRRMTIQPQNTRSILQGSSGGSFLTFSPQRPGQEMAGCADTPENIDNMILGTNQQTYNNMKNRRQSDRPRGYKRLEHANTQELLEKVTNNLKEAPLGRSLSMDRKLRS